MKHAISYENRNVDHVWKSRK